MSRSHWGVGRLDIVDAWRRLESAPVNYSPSEVRRPEWNFDTHRSPLPAEPTGPPEEGGPWENARRLVRDYEFSVPGLVRAFYDPAEPLAGRNMLLEARFHGLHFYCGVRITSVVDETRDNGDRVWGWAYETLEGHLERGRVSYEVVKGSDTGRVEFVVSSHSQAAPTLDPLTGLGWRVFGRRTQLRFYRSIGRRLRELVEADARGMLPASTPLRVGRLVCAPSDARRSSWDRLAVHQVWPG